jgi:MFS transporter, DHA1 family, inner membrane transport protein
VTIYLPAFFMLHYHMTAFDIAPVLAVVAVGTILGNVLGGWLGDRFLKPGIFVIAQLIAGTLGFTLFHARLRLPAALLLATILALANAASRPGFLAYGSELAPTQRGALFGLIALTNQSGLVIGSAAGAVVIGRGGFAGMAIAAVCQGVLAAGLALPLLRRPRSA